jgi:hypothetical protein
MATTATSFKPGNPGGGRPLGARNRLTEAFIQAIAFDFSKNGADAIRSVRETDPSTYIRVVASLVPKQLVPDSEGRAISEIIYRWADPTPGDA